MICGDSMFSLGRAPLTNIIWNLGMDDVWVALFCVDVIIHPCRKFKTIVEVGACIK